MTSDDSRTSRDMLRLTLTAAGSRVVQANDCQQGLEAEKPDLIFTGATSWIVKPFNPDKVVDALRRMAT